MNAEEFKHDPKAEEWVDPFPKKKSIWHSPLMAIIVVLGVYVLSVGPAIRLAHEKKIPAAILTVYAPLEYLSKTFSPLDGFFDWYISVCHGRNCLACKKPLIPVLQPSSPRRQ